MQPRPARNNLLAGLFVLVSVALAVVVSFMLADRGAGSGATRFGVRFSLSDGAHGLKQGSPVNLGGQPVGRVLRVEFHRAASTQGHGVADAVVAHVEVRGDVTLFKNAHVYLERPLLGTLSSINIADPGQPLEGADGATQVARVVSGDVVNGVLAPPAFLAQAGLGREQIDQIKGTIQGAQEAVDRLAGLVEKSSPEVEAALVDARSLLGDVRTSFDTWDKNIGATLANVESASARLEPLLENADAAVTSARKAFGDAERVIGDNRQKINDILANVQAATDTFNTETMALLTEAFRDARAAMGEAQLALGDVRNLVTQEGPGLRRTLANMRLMSDQLKLTAIEVRSHPWRLLHEPTTKELESQALYDATRSYASAASDVRAAAEAVQALSLAARKDPGDETSATALDSAGEELLRSMGAFRDAEQALLDRLIEQDRK